MFGMETKECNRLTVGSFELRPGPNATIVLVHNGKENTVRTVIDSKQLERWVARILRDGALK